jgi:hypothetical protein
VVSRFGHHLHLHGFHIDGEAPACRYDRVPCPDLEDDEPGAVRENPRIPVEQRICWEPREPVSRLRQPANAVLEDLLTTPMYTAKDLELVAVHMDDTRRR